MANILHIIHSLTLGGAGRTLIATAKYSSRFGDYKHKVLLLDVEHSDPEACRFLLDEGLELTAKHTKEQFLNELSKADIVQVNWWQHPQIDAFFREELPPLRLMAWFHCAGDRAPQNIPSWLVKFVDLPLGGSIYTGKVIDSICLSHGFSKKLSGAVIGGTDFARLQHLSKRKHEGFNIGYIGTVNFVKMHARFLEMSAAARIPDAKFIVCGGDCHEALQEKARDMNQSNRFDIRGYVEDIVDVLSVLDVYGYPLCPDTYAASELNLQEAMYAGIPVVVLPHGGIRELVIHDKTGIVANNEEDYTHALEYLYHNPSERSRLGEAAKQYAIKHFGAERNALMLNHYYDQLLTEPKRLHLLKPYLDKGGMSQGAERFLETLDSLAPEFETSYFSDNLGEILKAEKKIKDGSYLMCYSGVVPFECAYQNDGFLKLWAGLLIWGLGKPAQGAKYFAAALNLNLRCYHERLFYYIAFAALEAGDVELARTGLERLLEIKQDFPGAKELISAVHG